VGGAPGALSFGYFSRQDEKSDLLPGNPRRFSMGIATLNPSYASFGAIPVGYYIAITQAQQDLILLISDFIS